jgi:hypothetical protein
MGPTVEATVSAILAKPVDAQVHWLLVLLEEIDAGITHQHNKAMADEVLDTLCKAIRVRLEEDMW